jgi:predicted ChrR family anti-sigma factor
MIERLTCKDVASLLTDYLERTIPWNQRIRTSLHLRLCPQCLHLLAELQALPGVIDRFEDEDQARLLPIGEAALAQALGHLHEPRKAWRIPETPVPTAAQRLLSSSADLPLRLLALTHSAMLQGTAPRSEPFLPLEVLAQLPPAQRWKWRHLPGGVRRALLWVQENGPSLSLVFMPPNLSVPHHTHQGSESLLVLEGELEHAERCLTDGDWVHLESGSSHAPCAFGRGCWCLVRDEGTVHYDGPFGWIKGWVAGA